MPSAHRMCESIKQNLLMESTTCFMHAWCNLRWGWACQAFDWPTVAFFFREGSILSTCTLERSSYIGWWDMSMSSRVFLNPVTPNTKCQKVRCGYAALRKAYPIDILSSINGYTCISQGYDIIKKDMSCIVHRYTSSWYWIWNSQVYAWLRSEQKQDE